MADMRRGGRDNGDRDGSRPMRQRRTRRKICTFCADKIEHIEFKDTGRLRKFISERGKILPKRMSGNCARHQRELTIAIKRARHIALLPFSGE
jgi:small subunit ribosomal protein S18